jgi:hypothetical protein
MVTAVVEVTDPMRRTGPAPAPLVPGMFVEVAIEGRTLRNVIPVPRHAVHDGDEVWVVRDGTLRMLGVTVARRDRDMVYVTEGLEAGELVVVSPMDAVTDGMSVRIPGGPGGEDIVEGAAAQPASSATGGNGTP